MDNIEAVLERTKVVRRTLVPVMSDDPIPGRPRRNGLSRADMEIVVAGYACPKCLACWEGDTVRLKCPVCLHERSAADFLAGIKEWSDYLAYVEEEESKVERTPTTQPHEFVEAISKAAGVRPTYDRGLQRR